MIAGTDDHSIGSNDTLVSCRICGTVVLNVDRKDGVTQSQVSPYLVWGSDFLTSFRVFMVHTS